MEAKVFNNIKNMQSEYDNLFNKYKLKDYRIDLINREVFKGISYHDRYRIEEVYSTDDLHLIGYCLYFIGKGTYIVETLEEVFEMIIKLKEEYK